MRVVLIATHPVAGLDLLGERYSAAALPLVDRPMIQHVVERLVSAGLLELDVVVCHRPEQLVDLLGDGTRWGASVTTHLVRDPRRPYGAAARIARAHPGEVILVARADDLPSVDLEALVSDHQAEDVRLIRSYGASHWTGWALVPADLLASVPADADDRSFMGHISERAVKLVQVVAGPGLSNRTGGQLIGSHARSLSGTVPAGLRSGRKVEPGIWLSRNVVLPPTARVVAPAYIGEDCRIGKGVQIGPNATVMNGCIIEDHTTVKDSIVFEGTYLGPDLELDMVLADRNCLVNVALGSEATVSEAFIMGAASGGRWTERLRELASRLLALLLLLLSLPLLVVSVIWVAISAGGSPFASRAFVRLPVVDEPRAWRSFSMVRLRGAERRSVAGRLRRWQDLILRVVPALLNVLRGDLRLVGVTPRTADQIRSLSRDWRSLYLESRPGLITEALVNHGTSPSDDDLYTADAYYAVASSMTHDLRLLGRYAKRLLAN